MNSSFNTRITCPACGRFNDGCAVTTSEVYHCFRATLPPAGYVRLPDDSRLGAMRFVIDGQSPRHRSSNYTAPPVNEFEAYYRQKCEQLRRDASAAKRSAEDAKSDAAFHNIINTKAPLTHEERDWLANRLCLPTGIFDLLGVEHTKQDGHNCRAFVFPERDGKGEAIGFALRYDDDSKEKRDIRFRGHRGLYIPSDWLTACSNGPLVIPEGATDTLALRAMGIAAIGRPSDLGGVDHLAELLREFPRDRAIIILGENDKKPDGRWPGRNGAEKTATKLADALGRPVLACIVPSNVKDARGLIIASRDSVRAGERTLADLGRELLAHIAVACYIPPDAIEQTAIDSKPTVSAASDTVQMGWTARDFYPAADADSIADAGVKIPHGCPNRKKILCRSIFGRDNRVMLVDCRQLTCPHCHKQKRAQYQATITGHLLSFETANPGKPVFVFQCDASAWPSISRRLRATDADYFRLDVSAFSNSLLVLSTAPPPPSRVGSSLTEMQPFNAGERLCQAIDNIPELRPKIFTSSRRWKLIGEVKSNRPNHWRRICKIDATDRMILDVLEYHRVDWKPVSERGMFWGWDAWQWSDSQVRDPERLLADIRFGEVLPDISDDIWAPESVTISDNSHADNSHTYAHAGSASDAVW